MKKLLKRLTRLLGEYGPELGPSTSWIMAPNDEDRRNWPAILTVRPRQLFGGKTWSLSLVTHMKTDASIRVHVQRNSAVAQERLETQIKERESASH